MKKIIKKWYITIIISCFVCVCAWVIFSRMCYISRMNDHRDVFPLGHINKHVSLFCKGVNGGIEKIEIEKILTNSEISSLEYNRKLAEIFNKSTYGYLKKDIENDGFIAPDGLFYDAWGIPVYFMQTNNVDFHKLHPDLKRFKKDFPVIAWSSGKNKSNEFGYGDDIYVEKYVKQLVNNYP